MMDRVELPMLGVDTYTGGYFSQEKTRVFLIFIEK